MSTSAMIYRHRKQRNFTMVENSLIDCQYLSLEAKALLIWMLSKPEGFKFTVSAMCKIHGVSKNKMQRITDELRDNNHLRIERLNSGYTVWHAFETHEEFELFNDDETPITAPHPQNEDKPYPQNPDVAFEDVLIRRDLNKTKISTHSARDALKEFDDEPFEKPKATAGEVVAACALKLTDMMRRAARKINADPDCELEREFEIFKGHHDGKVFSLPKWLSMWMRWDNCHRRSKPVQSSSAKPKFDGFQFLKDLSEGKATLDGPAYG